MAKKPNKPNRPKEPNISGQQTAISSEVRRQIHAIARSELFSGPLPPPQVLEKYNQVVPGAADRIIAMAESQSKHRQDLELKVITADIRSAKLGLWFGLIIGLTAIIGGVSCIIMGGEIGGSVIGGTGITGLVGVFVYGSTQRRKEREIRYQKMISANGK